MFDGSAGSIGDERECSPPPPPTVTIVAACVAAFVLVLGMVVFRRHWKQKAWAYWTPNPMHEHKDTVGGQRSVRLFKNGADCAVQITRGTDDAQLSTLVPARWLIEEKQLCLSKEVLGGGSSGIVKKGTFGSRAVAVKHVSLHFLNMEDDHLKSRQREEGDDPILKSFQRECQVLGSLAHPNCVAFYGFSFTPDWFLLVMELCTGEGYPRPYPNPNPHPNPTSPSP
jgi:hypothetical protein